MKALSDMGSGRSSADLGPQSSKSSSTTTSIYNVRVGQEGELSRGDAAIRCSLCAGYAKADPSGTPRSVIRPHKHLEPQHEGLVHYARPPLPTAKIVVRPRESTS